MAVSLYTMTVPAARSMLTNLAAVLEKGAKHAADRGFENKLLAGSRLAPDMFDLARQVQLSCDFAKNSCARLVGLEPPRLEDTETTLEELVARIHKTIEYLDTLTEAQFDGAESREIKVPLRNRTLEMQGLPFVQRWMLPNFYFHVTAAYAILRSAGVQLGKQDYLGGV